MSGNFSLTPEQIAQAQKLGSQPIQQTSPQQVQPPQQAAIQNQTVQQVQQSQPPVSEAQQIQQQQQAAVAPEPAPVQPPIQESSLENLPEQTDLMVDGEKQTYFVVEGEKSVLELDLVTFREKNKETRFFTMKIHIKGEGENSQRQTTNFFVDSIEKFDKLKTYFTQLGWDD